MNKEDVTHIYNGILLSHKKKKIELFVVRWMDLESIIQSEVSQKKKRKRKGGEGSQVHSMKVSIILTKWLC